MKYDQWYQEWLQAKETKNYELADSIRTDFERYHGLTIFAEGEMPIEGVTVRRMLWSAWENKYGNSKVGAAMAEWDSKVRYRFPNFKGTFINTSIKGRDISNGRTHT